jgi:hypothetical protein
VNEGSKTMSPDDMVIAGTLKPDGTLELDQKPDLSPGRVTVILRPLPELPRGDAFWQRMQAIWDAQKAAGCVPRSAEEIESERRALRDEWEARQQAFERLQQGGRTARPADEGSGQ